MSPKGGNDKLDQIEFFDIPSPCKRVCQIDKQGYCITCYRSREERFKWLTFSRSFTLV
uniref:DUF1289 domain-containing protein n=1 Tax=Gilliamella sp. Nev6-6 TaxID=3120252 RepID=UPI003FA59090